jgi:hypothetical protein
MMKTLVHIEMATKTRSALINEYTYPSLKGRYAAHRFAKVSQPTQGEILSLQPPRFELCPIPKSAKKGLIR